jgi:uncharacterized phage protein (TIGR02216 family)
MSDDTFGRAAARRSGAASLLLGWRPDDFWNSTPAELALAMIIADGEGQAPDARTIEALKQRFPDQQKA